jgi:hypothetical protein
MGNFEMVITLSLILFGVTIFAGMFSGSLGTNTFNFIQVSAPENFNALTEALYVTGLLGATLVNIFILFINGVLALAGMPLLFNLCFTTPLTFFWVYSIVRTVRGVD